MKSAIFTSKSVRDHEEQGAAARVFAAPTASLDEPITATMLKPAGRPTRRRKERGADHRRGGGVKAYVNAVEAGADRLADLLRLIVRTRSATRHGATTVPRRDCGGARDQAKKADKKGAGPPHFVVAGSGGRALPRHRARRTARLAAQAPPAQAAARRPPPTRRRQRSAGSRLLRGDGRCRLARDQGATGYEPRRRPTRYRPPAQHVGPRDEFQFVWRKITGDFLVRTHGSSSARGRSASQAGGIVRKWLDAESPYVDAAMHGDGLTSLQFRRRRRGRHRDDKSAVTTPTSSS